MPTDIGKIIYTAEDRTGSALKAISSNMEEAKRHADRLKTAFAGIATGFVATQIVDSFRVVIAQGEELNKLAARTGIATESLSTLTYAAKLANVDQDTLASGTKKLAVSMAAAAGGGKEAAAVFGAMGISVTDANGKLKGTDAVLREVAEKFGTYEDGAGKAALAVALFGKSGDSLIPMLNNLRAAEEEGRKVAAVYGGDFAAASEQVSDNMTKLSAATEAAKLAIARDLLPGLADITTEFVRNYTEGNKLLAILKALGQVTGFADTDNLARQKKFVDDTERLFEMQRRIEQMSVNKASPGDPDSPSLRRAKGAAATLEADLARRRVVMMAGDPSTFDARDLQLMQKYPAPLTRTGEGDKPPAGGRGARDNSDALMRESQRGLYAMLEMEQAAADDYVYLWDTANETRIQINKRVFEDMERQAAEQAKREQKMWIDAIDRQEELDRATGLAANGGKSALQGMEDQLRRNEEAARRFGLTFTSALEDAIFSSDKAISAMGLLSSAVNDIGRGFFRSTITEPSLAFLFGEKGKGKGLLGDLFSGFFADGGYIPPGQWGIVGERGPEPAFGGRTGLTITPSASAGNTYYSIDARGADAAGLARLERTIRELNGSLERRAVNAVVAARGRDPELLK
jgi:DNA-binding Xre family transcriptional regulator